MNIQKIKYKIKTSQVLSLFFLLIMSCFFRILSLFLKRKKQILFSSFSGRQYSDSPKIIYNSLKADIRFSDYELKWALVNPSDFPEIPEANKIKIDSFRFYIELFSSSVWVANGSIERLIPFKPRNIIYINTWHGIPLKHLGPDEHEITYIVQNWFAKVNFDLLTASGKYDREIFKHIFPNTNNIQITGLPRNLSLYNKSNDEKNEIKSGIITKYDLDEKKPIILYAPTFREYELDSDDYAFKGLALERLAKKYNVLFRGHYYSEDNKIKKILTNVSDEPNLNNLLIASDILISDYSSIIFDYSILKKPIYLYCYDLEDYLNYRGVYLDPRKLGLPIARTEDELVHEIFNGSGDSRAFDFFNKFNDNFDKNLTVIKNVILHGE